MLRMFRNGDRRHLWCAGRLCCLHRSVLPCSVTFRLEFRNYDGDDKLVMMMTINWMMMYMRLDMIVPGPHVVERVVLKTVEVVDRAPS